MKKLTDYLINSNNPFIEEMMDIKVSARRRIIAGKDPHMVVDKNGEVQGSQVFAVHERVDKEQFTKVFRQGLAGMFGLSNPGIKVFSYIATIVKPNKVEVYFDSEECQKYTGYKTPRSVLKGLAELCECEFIARTSKHYKYYINPNMFFNGSRVAFMKVYEADSEGEALTIKHPPLPDPERNENT